MIQGRTILCFASGKSGGQPWDGGWADVKDFSSHPRLQ